MAMALTFFHAAEANLALFASLMTEIAQDISARHVVEPRPLRSQRHGTHGGAGFGGARAIGA